MSSNGVTPVRGAGRGSALMKQLELARKFAPFPTINPPHSSRPEETANESGSSDQLVTKQRGHGRGKIMNEASSLSATSQSKTLANNTGPLGLEKLRNILQSIEKQKPPSSSTSETDSTAEADETFSKASSSDLADELVLSKKGTKGM